MSEKTVDLSGIRDVDLDQITLRTVNADDMLEAAARCVPPDGGNIDENLFRMMLRQQLVAQAIKDYSLRGGTKVTIQGSCQDSLKWSARTREFVGEIFDHLNSVAREERDAFLKALASPSIPGSQGDVRAA